ncbi:MAG: 4Fe-4S dicluster domain-containing protein, partial [Clostridia bacterium]|nr:4Fe-4S dicluster domain-containing protein [Clostridia bacterium]
MSLTNTVTAEDLIRISGVDPSKCMQCGKCSGACPSYDEMEYHPHQFVAMVRKGQIEKLMASDAIYQCLSCFACLERCPRNVEPAKLIEAVRVAVIRQQGMVDINDFIKIDAEEAGIYEKVRFCVLKE